MFFVFPFFFLFLLSPFRNLPLNEQRACEVKKMGAQHMRQVLLHIRTWLGRVLSLGSRGTLRRDVVMQSRAGALEAVENERF